MYPCPSFRVFFSTDSLAIFEAITQLYTDDISKEMVGGYYSAVLSKPKVRDRIEAIDDDVKKQYFNDIELSNEYDYKVLVVTSICHSYLNLDFNDYDVLITVGIFQYMDRALAVNPKLTVFCTNTLSDCRAFTKMLFMTFASDCIVDIDLYDLVMFFGMSNKKSKLIHHLGFEELIGKDESINYALVYGYGIQIGLSYLTDIYMQYTSLDIPNMCFLGCTGNRAVDLEEGIFVVYDREE